MATLTVYSGLQDGRIYGTSTTYATARSTGSNVSTLASVTAIGQWYDAGTYFCYEQFWAFDTSAIAGGTVTSAVFSLTHRDDYSYTDFDIEVRSLDWSSGGLTTADYIAGASLGDYTRVAYWNTSGYSSEKYYAYTSESAFAAAVSTSGYTYLFGSSSLQRAGTAPTAEVTDQDIACYMGDQAGTTSDPKLVVTFTPASGTSSVAVGFPATIASTNTVSPYDDNDWSTVTRLGIDDGSYTSITASSFDNNVYSYLVNCQGFGFAIPTGAMIVGVVVRLDGYYATATFAVAHIKLLNASGTAEGDDNYADDGNCASTDSAAPDNMTYGGVADLWGVALTPTMVNDVDFGVRFAIQAKGNNCDAYIDSLKMTVYYVVPTGTGGVTTKSAEIAGTGTVTSTPTGTGALTTKSPEIAGTGTHIIKGTGALGVTGPSLAGTGHQDALGTGELTTTSPELSGEGTITETGVSGTGALTTTTPSIDGTGTNILLGTGGLTTSSPSLDGEGQLTYFGTGGLDTTSPALDGAGTAHWVGSGGLAPLSPELDGAGTVIISGSGALAPNSPAIAGSGGSGSFGIGSLTTQTVQISGEGTVTVLGTGALEVAVATLLGAGKLTESGSGGVTLPALSLDGEGKLTYFGTGELTTQSPALSGGGTVAVAATEGAGGLELGGLALSGSGVETRLTDHGSLFTTRSRDKRPRMWEVGMDKASFRTRVAPIEFGRVPVSAHQLRTGTGGLTVGALSLLGAGEASIVVISGTGALAVPVISLAGTGDSDLVYVTGTGALTTHSLSLAGVGTHEESEGYTEVANFALTSGESSQTYEWKRFTGNGSGSTNPDVAATVYITHAHDITFNNCIFDTCTAVGTGSYAGYLIGNTLKILPYSYDITNITFNNCLFKSAARMCVEVNGRGAAMTGLTFSYCTFEPSRAEPLSLDDDNSLCGGYTIDHCVLGGGGYVLPSSYPFTWRQNLEIANAEWQGTNVYSNNTHYSSMYSQMNLRGSLAGWSFTNNHVYGATQYTDALADALSCPTSGNFTSGSGIVQSTEADMVHSGEGLTGGTWSGNSFVNDNGWCSTYLINSHDIDFNATWSGDNATVHYESGCTNITYT